MTFRIFSATMLSPICHFTLLLCCASFALCMEGDHVLPDSMNTTVSSDAHPPTEPHVDLTTALPEVSQPGEGEASDASHNVRMDAPAQVPLPLRCYQCNSPYGSNLCSDANPPILKNCTLDTERCSHIEGELVYNHSKLYKVLYASCGHAQTIEEYPDQSSPGIYQPIKETHNPDNDTCVEVLVDNKVIGQGTDGMNITATFHGKSCNCRESQCNFGPNAVPPKSEKSLPGGNIAVKTSVFNGFVLLAVSLLLIRWD